MAEHAGAAGPDPRALIAEARGAAERAEEEDDYDYPEDEDQ